MRLPGWAPTVDDTIRILPGAENADGGELPTDATRAEVTNATPDIDGDLRMRLLDGDDAGDLRYILPEFVAHPDAMIDEPTPAPAPSADIVIGREYRLLPNAETVPGDRSQAVVDRVTRVRVARRFNGANGGTYTPVPERVYEPAPTTDHADSTDSIGTERSTPR